MNGTDASTVFKDSSLSTRTVTTVADAQMIKRKKAVLTIAIGPDYHRIGQLTHPILRKYAKKIGAEFVVINKKFISQTTPHWEKFQIFNLLEKYERILYLDSDLIIRDDCPDLFKIVPPEKLGVFNEAPFTDRSKELMIDICKQYGETLQSWNGKYYNSGVMVISQKHKYMFRKPEKEIFSFYEQSYLNMIIAKENIDVYELPHKFNRMTCVDCVTGEERYDSYIIHYAGYPSLAIVLELIKKDLYKWKNDKGNYVYKKHIYVSVSGGLGDQVGAEPAVRFMRDKLYPHDEFVIATHFPTIFKHLANGNGTRIVEHGKADLNNDTPYFITETLKSPKSIQWAVCSHLMSHMLDYSSICLMKRTLPVVDRQIKIDLKLDEMNRMFDITGRTNFDSMIVIHPGRHWQSKTFPVEYWQQIIDGLVKAGKDLCIIGLDSPGDPPDFIAGSRGTVDVICPKGAIDLRNKLSLDQTLALLSLSKVLISNDSAPIHLAGAFDNWIVLLPSCKHPDHILPWRNGSPSYKTMALYKRLVIDDIDSSPTRLYEQSADVDVPDWSKYLLESDGVVRAVLELQ